MAVTTISNAELIEKHRTSSAQALHDELAIGIRKVFAELSPQEIKNAINCHFTGRCYIVEFPVSNIFKEEYLYDIDNTIRMSPLFEAVRRISLFEKEGVKFVRVWLRGDIRKFLPKDHKHYKPQ